MSQRHTEHEILVAAPVDAVYALVADVTRWPTLFPPTVHVQYLEYDAADEERLRIWATANGAVKSWVSRRRLDRAAGRIAFRQEASAHPVAAMSGEWVITPVSDTESRVVLTHDFRAVDDDPAALDWISAAVDRNSEAELAALKAGAEAGAQRADLLLSFEDSVVVPGPAQEAYDFIADGDKWVERLPHVARVNLRRETPEVQWLELETRTRDGSTHTTESIRVLLPDAIVYKQLKLPGLLSVHTGRWSFTPTGDDVTVTSRHTVVLRPEAIEPILGEGADVARARSFIRDALGDNSRATLELAKAYAQGRVPAGAEG